MIPWLICRTANIDDYWKHVPVEQNENDIQVLNKLANV